MILVLGGTHETTQVCSLLNKLNLNYIISVTTEFGADLYGHLSKQCIVTKFDDASLDAFIVENQITLIIDATHPHAALVKQLARGVASRLNINYILYQRTVDLDVSLPTFESMAKAIDHVKKNSDTNTHILITGIKHIREWKAAFNVNQLYFRIMPSLESLKICLDENIPVENIVAIKAPCSIELNQTLFRDFEIDYFVFKNSGTGSAFKQNVDSLKNTSVKPICIQPHIQKDMNICSDIVSLNRMLEDCLKSEVSL